MKTEASIEKGFKKTVKFELEKEEFDKYRKTSFDKFKKTAKVDGFRPGKVPESMLRSKFSASIEAEAVNEAVNSSYREYLIENKIYPLNDPVIESVDTEEDELKFTASFEVYPEFELKDHTGITVEQEKITASEKEIDGEINKILDAHSSSKETDSAVADGHIVNVSIKPVGQNNAEWEEQVVEIGKNPDDTLDKQFIGLKKGDVKTINLGAEGEDSPAYKFEVRIDRVGEKVLPEFNDEFAKTLDSKFSTAGELRNDIEEKIRSGKQKEQDNAAFDKIAAKIIEAHDNFEVPPSVLNNYLEDIVTNTQKQYGKNLDREMIKNIYGQNAALSLKWEYIRHKLIEEKNFSVEDNEIEERMEEIARDSSIGIDKVKKYYSGKEKTAMLKQDILEKKVRKYILENNTVNLIDKPEEKEEDKTSPEE
ncbi:MAG: trigger factor [Candidatus Delongbacteria bacterium]|nr:trigger factor [Candidatus Delongbacteria bacterium]